MQLKKPSRYHRIDREPAKFHLEDDTGHLWAVSYADFLMVLLSFFILFFSVNNKDKNTIINIITKVKERGLGSGNGGGSLPSGVGRQVNSVAAASPAAIVEQIRSRVPNLQIEVNDKEKSVTFLLDDEIFTPGGITMSSKGVTDLSGLLDLLKPYVKDVDLIFVGHTDPRPITVRRISLIENNFDLSALRAAQAVKLAMKQGLPKESLYTHGSADNTRATKSLSLVVVQKGEGRI